VAHRLMFRIRQVSLSVAVAGLYRPNCLRPAAHHYHIMGHLLSHTLTTTAAPRLETTLGTPGRPRG